MIECRHCKTPLPDDSKFCGSCGAHVSDPSTLTRGSMGDEAMLVRLRRAVEGRYKITGTLGRGGMATVLLADDLVLERPVAIKVLPLDLSLDDSFVSRFQREARTAAKLDHPNIIPIYAVESQEDLHYFVMKWIDGRSLDELLRGEELPFDVCRKIIWEAARALGHAHQRGVVHRDVKPANIMIDQHDRVILTDFGISKAESATHITATGQLVGTPHYMSPEQAKGIPVDGRSDQYSLGIVAYRILTGQLPFGDAPVHTVIYQHISETPRPLREVREDIPQSVAAAITKALSKSPDERFRSMEEFAAAVSPTPPISGAAPTPPDDPSMPGLELASAPGKRRAVPIAVAATVVAGSVLTFAIMRLDGRPEETAPIPAQVASGDSLPVASPGDSLRAGDVGDTATPTGGQGDPAPVAAPTQPVTTPTTPPPQQAAAPQPAAPAVGFLTINATPFGTVAIDGVEIGDTPLVRHELAPGQHIVTISKPGWQTTVDTIVITAGNVRTRQKTLVRQNE